MSKYHEFLCPKCEREIAAPPAAVGQKTRCNLCAAVIVVPTADADRQFRDDIQRRNAAGRSQKEAEALQTRAQREQQKKKITKILVGLICVIAVGFSFWFFAIRDTWEQDHSSQILALHDQAMELKAHNDLPGASAKLHELLALVGKRNLRDDGLRSVVDDSRTNSQVIDRLLILREVPKHLQDAADLLESDKIEESRAAYHAVLDAISAQGTNAPDVLRAADCARDGLRQVDARQAAIVAERSRQEAKRAAAEQRKREEAALAKQRDEEAARNAKIRATVSGGAWIVKGGGTSDVLRGMNVYLLTADCSGTTIRQSYQHAAGEMKASAAFWRKEASKLREEPKGYGYGALKKLADHLDARANALEEYATAVIADAKKIPDRMNVRDTYRLMREVNDSQPDNKEYSIVAPLGERFGDVVQECAQQTVHVNIDGKFSFDPVHSGKYYLYANWSTEFSSIEWLIPLNVKESGMISQDLFNDTAAIIRNKKE